MTVESTLHSAPGKGAKPQKPRPDFPLYAHGSGKWAKTIRGHDYYFGTWDDPEGALREYLDRRDDLEAGRTPAEAKNGLTVRDLANAFIRAKRVKLDTGQLSSRSFVDYDRTCRVLLEEFGPTRRVADLRPTDFEKLYANLASKCVLSTLGREVTMIRSVFKYADEADLIDRRIKFGPTFKAPSKQNLKKAKTRTEQTNGEKLFSAEDIRRLLGAADPQVKAMILLGINGGMGNNDCASLPCSALDLDRGWLKYPRPKTGTDRRIPLWPETVEALRAVIANRRKAADDADAGLVFLTKYGLRWVRYGFDETQRLGRTLIRAKQDNQLAKAFGKLLSGLGLRRPGIGFYALRHTFETVAGDSKDQVTVDAIMGHADPSMAGHYRHGLEDARLTAVVEHVHTWLFGEADKTSESAATN